MNDRAFTHERIEQTAEKIMGFRQVQPGWHYGSGTQPSQETIDKALQLNAEASRAGFTETNAFLGIDGEIQVTAYHGPIYLELTVEPDGEVTFAFEQGDEEMAYEENLSLQEARERIGKFRGITWVSFGLSIRATTIPKKDASKVLLFDHPAMVAEYPSLTKSAFYKQAQVSVDISKHITGTSPGRSLSSGTYLPNVFLNSAGSYSKPAQPETSATATS